ncbi:GNAT family N-acetyltransferase [soil metagenome]
MSQEISFTVPDCHLVARRIGLEDAEDWFEFAVLPEVRRHTSGTVESLADVQAAIGRALTEDANAPVYFTLRDMSSSGLVAIVGFHTRSVVNRSAEINYELRPERWGRGVATAVCREAVRWGFSQLGLVRIQATTLEENVASQRVLQKAGFAPEGMLRNFRIVRGTPRNYLVFSTIPTSP